MNRYIAYFVLFLGAAVPLYAGSEGNPGGPQPAQIQAVGGKDTSNGKLLPLAQDTTGRLKVIVDTAISASGIAPGDSKANVIQGIAGGTAVPVSIASVPSHAVTNAGTFAVQVTSAPSTAVTNAGTFATQAVTTPKQYTGTPSSYAILTADGTVFTLAAGEVGFIQNLSADAPLAVKYGASASTTSFNFILAKSGAASDGTGGAYRIDNWVGAVSVAKMTGTGSYVAWKYAP